MADAPPPPPRYNGDFEAYAPQLVQYLYDLRNANAAYFAQAGTDATSSFDPSTLPDPASTSLGQAQTTANSAYILAAQANTSAEAAVRAVGSITISELATTAVLTFTEAESDTLYNIHVTQTSQSGAPSSGSANVITITKTVDDVTIEIGAAPGAGTSRTFNVSAVRLSRP